MVPWLERWLIRVFNKNIKNLFTLLEWSTIKFCISCLKVFCLTFQLWIFWSGRCFLTPLSISKLQNKWWDEHSVKVLSIKEFRPTKLEPAKIFCLVLRLKAGYLHLVQRNPSEDKGSLLSLPCWCGDSSASLPHNWMCSCPSNHAQLWVPLAAGTAQKATLLLWT